MIKKIGIIIVIAVLTIISTYLIAIFVTEYRPKDIEYVDIKGKATKFLNKDEKIKIITNNIGYLALDKTQDFFMDGGNNVKPDSKKDIERNLKLLKSMLKKQDADIYLIQEVDINSKRSYYMNQQEQLEKEFLGVSAFALYHKCMYIPYPVFDAVGKVESGMSVFSKYDMQSTRYSLPGAYNSIMKAIMFKRCIMEQRIKIDNIDKELIVYNVHFEAYDKGNTRQEQLEFLKDLIVKEYSKGNYVIVGGDFNHKFPDANNDKYPVIDESHFKAKNIGKEFLPENFSYAYDDTKPTARLLNKPYSGDYKETQLYVLDGFIVSDNIEVVNVKTLENGFIYSDHHPVLLEVKLK